MSETRRLLLALKELADVFAVNLTPHVAATYTDVLGDCSLDEIEFLSKRAIETSVFMPRPAELLVIVKQFRGTTAAQEQHDKLFRDAEQARKNRCDRAFNRPEGKTVLGYLEELLSQGLSREQAVERICQ